MVILALFNMCGIVGYIGPQHATDIVIGGLRKLEYRGYDSSGIALLGASKVLTERATGKLINLERKLHSVEWDGADARGYSIGMGHTRWATHGGVTEANAHPHVSMNGRVAVVHNGIVENATELKNELLAAGVKFSSETDTEVIVHLVARYIAAGMSFEHASHSAIARLRGSQAIVLLCLDEPDQIIACRMGNAGGVVVGVGDGEMFLASDIPGILEHTRQIIFLENQEVVVIRQHGFAVRALNGDVVAKTVTNIPYDVVSAEKGEYRHFLQKEIFEHARAITDTIRGRVDFATGRVTLEALDPWNPQRSTSSLGDTGSGAYVGLPSKIFTAACGTSLYSGMVGKFLIEGIARIPVEVEHGSELRYRDPLIEATHAVLGITQSGETADTLAAMTGGREKGARIWSIVNSMGSQAQRMSEGTISMRAGPEISVCSTKSFVVSIVDQYLLACALAQRSPFDADGSQVPSRTATLALDLAHLPTLVGRTLEKNPIYEQLAAEFHDREHFLFLGRGINYPIALEGALKLKEVSYIHAEGYPAGEMKHGPIALIDERMPVVCICVKDAVYEKMLSQVEQVKARGGKVIAIATEGDSDIAQKADRVIYVPAAPALLSPILTAIPMQRLAYEMAIRRGCDVDQPRNLAKSVTVE